MSKARAPLRDAFLATRAATEKLAAPLSAEDQTVQSMDDASPVKWHRAHTTWFFETFLLKPFVQHYTPFDESFEVLFNSYYNAVGKQYPRPHRGMVTRPGVMRIGDYRAYVDEAVLLLMDGAEDAQWPEISNLLRIGINHEQQHQELLCTDFKHALSFNVDGSAAWDAPAPTSSDTSLSWISFEGGLCDIGAAKDEFTFTFDNEFPQHQAFVAPFTLADRLVTCGEFLEFMADGGYTTPSLWLSDGWATVNTERWRAPLYWHQEGDSWNVLTLHGRTSVTPDAPVTHLSYFEAAAFAEWAGKRLPRENEWEVAARTQKLNGQFLDPGTSPHPCAAGPSDGTLRQMFGTCWEWTQSPYVAYPGYHPAEGAVGEYNGKFMSGQMVLRGGSCATPAGHVRPTYRNFFYPHQRWQFTGIRLAEDS